MAATITLLYQTDDFLPKLSNSLGECEALVVFDNSYPTGGEAVDLQTDLGIPSGATIKVLQGEIVIGLAAGFMACHYDESTEKILLYDEAGAEVANTTDASSVTVLARVLYTV